jgi:hypothetical protein
MFMELFIFIVYFPPGVQYRDVDYNSLGQDILSNMNLKVLYKVVKVTHNT